MNILAVADEVVESLTFGVGIETKPDLILGAGDLPYKYLDVLSSLCDAPCVFVPGNHDGDLRGYRSSRAGWTRAGLPTSYPGPECAVNADGRTVTAAGVRISGLGGSIRYNSGPNQYTEAQQRLRSWVLRARGGVRATRPHILLTHSPARGAGDAEDPPHRGFSCFHPLVDRLRPKIMVHGHIHPYGAQPRDLIIGTDTVSMNVVGYCQFDFDTDTGDFRIVRRRYGS